MLRALAFTLAVGFAGISGGGFATLAQAQDVDYSTLTPEELIAAIVEACSGSGPCQEVIAAIATDVGTATASTAASAAAAAAPEAAETIQTAAASAGVSGSTSATGPADLNNENPGDNGGDTAVGDQPPASGN